MGLLQSGPLSLCSNYPRDGHQTTRDTTVPQSPLRLFKLANPKPACPASPSPSHGNHEKDSCPLLLLAPSASLWTLVLPQVASCFSGSVGIKSFSVSYHTWLKWISDTLKTPAAAKSLQLCLTLCDTMDCSLPGPSVHGILQGRILEWVAMPSSRGSSQPRDRTSITYISCISR